MVVTNKHLAGLLLSGAHVLRASKAMAVRKSRTASVVGTTVPPSLPILYLASIEKLIHSSANSEVPSEP